nr:AAA family ATPase [Thioclava sp.]
MKLRALRLTNVRKFGGRTASLTGIGDGLTVVSEANEFGKSTFFDALYALFFHSYTSASKPVKSLQPHAGGGVIVAAEVETVEGTFLIEKHFLAKKGATVRDLRRDAVIARDGEAESWISAVIGEAEHGPAGLLWVRQGVVGLEPSDGSKAERDKLTEARRDLMSSVVGEIDQVTGGRRMDRILARCNADLEKIATSTGRPRGAWKEAVEREADLRAEHEVLEARCKELAEALAERGRDEAELARLDDPRMSAFLDKDLSDARTRMAAAETYAAKVGDAEKALRIAELERDQAAEAFGQLVANEKALDETVEALRKADATHAEAAAVLAAAREVEAKAREANDKADEVLKTLRAELGSAERAVAARKAREEVEALDVRIVTARGHYEEALKARAQIEANRATPKALSAAEEAADEVTRLISAVQARAAALTVHYEGAVRITLNGAEVLGEKRMRLGEAVEIGLPGIGRMQLDLPTAVELEKLEEELTQARAAEAAAYAACGVDSLSAARGQARKRAAALEAQKFAENLVQVTAPEGLEALEASLAAAREAAAPEVQQEGRLPADIRADLDVAEKIQVEARRHHDHSREALEEARVGITRSEGARDAARLARKRAEAELGSEKERPTRHAVAQAAAISTADYASECEVALRDLLQDAPDLATEAANLKRATVAVEVNGNRRAKLRERLAELGALIRTRAGENVEARRDEVSGELASLDTRLRRFAAEKEALNRLRETLEAAREGAREAYFGPVQEELAPLLAILHHEAAIDWESDTIMPIALRREGEVEEFDTLSGGTQEQIAILTRLAFARLFARRGQHLPIILDDALVYSDDDRIVKMFTALNRVAADQQILVFSCRQMAFASLGGERPKISLGVVT